MDTPLIRTLGQVPLVSVLTGFHCIRNINLKTVSLETNKHPTAMCFKAECVGPRVLAQRQSLL